MGLNIKCGFVAGAAFLASMGAWANGYTIIDLGGHHVPAQVNEGGDVAASDRHLSGSRPLVLRGGHWHRLGHAGAATSIDVDGLVGGGTFFKGVGYIAHTWEADGARNDFQLPAGGTDGVILSTSQGRAIGDYTPAGAGLYTHCFTAGAHGGETVDIGIMSGVVSCDAGNINASGQVAGSGQHLDATFEAFVWADGVFTNLGTLPGSTSTLANYVNDLGHVVGDALDSGGKYQSFLWEEGVMTSLGASSNFYSTTPLSINNQDVAVGLGYSYSRRGTYAVRFESGQIIDLETEVVNGAGWKLREATTINDNGVIAGSGVFMGDTHGFMLVPTGGH